MVYAAGFEGYFLEHCLVGGFCILWVSEEVVSEDYLFVGAHCDGVDLYVVCFCVSDCFVRRDDSCVVYAVGEEDDNPFLLGMDDAMSTASDRPSPMAILPSFLFYCV